ARNITNSLSGADVLTGLTTTSYLDTAALPNRPYYYWVQATGGLCGSTSPIAGPVAGYRLPSAGDVNNFRVSRGTPCGGILLSWAAATDASNYDLWRNSPSDVSTAEYLGPTSQTSYLDSVIPPLNAIGGGGRFWYYWVRAHAPCGNSPTVGPMQG